MTVRGMVVPAVYLDSVVLLRLARVLRAEPGVHEAAALMGTPANRELLRAAGLSWTGAAGAGPGDLVVAVAAETDKVAEATLGVAERWLAGRRDGPGLRDPRGSGEVVRPRTLPSAVRRFRDANLCAVSVPGLYATREARRALGLGLHVFLFSDHVTLADEIALKELAARRGLLCMGPDCGTAYLGGIGLGFANVVPRGRVGIVAASGTGLQAVAAHLVAQGEGVSHGIGVGGRDLSATVGGRMTRSALAALGRDVATRAIVLISKAPDPAVLSDLAATLESLRKPVVIWGVGAPASGLRTTRVETLEDAAVAAVAAVAGQPWGARPFTDPSRVRAWLATVAAGGARGPDVRAFYTGGTLAAEARSILEPLIGPVARGETERPGPGHRVVDLGDDAYTLGRPHPMLDAEARAEGVRAVGRDSAVGVLMVDLVLGRGAHPDPAGPLAGAIKSAREEASAAGRALVVVGSVVGTEADPQGLARQVATLEAAGAVVLPTNAQAARVAALVVRPDLAGALLGTGAPVAGPPGAANRSEPGEAPRRARGGSLPTDRRPRASHDGAGGGAIDALLTAGPRVINVGLETFAHDLADQQAPVLHVDWRPPAGGDPRLGTLLALLDDDPGEGSAAS